MSKLLKSAASLLLSLSIISSWASDTDIGKMYQAIYVAKVEVEADMDRNSPDEVKYYADLETEATAMLKKYFTDEGYTVLDSPDPENDKLLIVNTKALFNAGNRALRWVGGIGGAGKASADVTIEAVEQRSGKLLSSRNAKDTLRMGGFGGSAPSMLMGAVDSAWNYLITDLNVSQSLSQ